MATPTLVPRQTTSMVTTSMPLTTIFTPPSWCSTLPVTFYQTFSGTSTFWRNAYGLDDTIRSSCYPYSYAYQHEPTVAAEYSPGVCPKGYTGADVEQNGVGAPVTSYCCPSGMTYATMYGCESWVSTSTLVAQDSTTNITMTDPFMVADWYIKVVWASSDLASFTPASAPILTTAAAAATVTETAAASSSGGATSSLGATPSATSSSATSSSATSTATSTSTPSPGLTTGAQVGIGVGVGVGALAIIGLLIAFFFRRRRSRRNIQDHAQVGAPPTISNNDVKDDAKGQYMQVPQMHEVDGQGRPYEADGTNFRAELESNWQPHELPMNR